jgi:ribosomal-protein-alanine N-acetyltransferase
MRVYLERPSLRREADFLAAVRRSRQLHEGFVSPPSNPDAYRRYLRLLRQPDQGAFFVTLAGSDELAGVVTIDDIARRSFQFANLGYYSFTPYAGQGLMFEGGQLAIRHCFRELKLHRLEANIQSTNQRSIGLVERLGFRREGLAVRFAKVAGRWRDHERWALLVDEWRPMRLVPRERTAAGRAGG